MTRLSAPAVTMQELLYAELDATYTAHIAI